jgi:hypothetical protein
MSAYPQRIFQKKTMEIPMKTPFLVINSTWNKMLRDPFIRLNVDTYRKCADMGCRVSAETARVQLRQAVLKTEYKNEASGFLRYVDVLLITHT